MAPYLDELVLLFMEEELKREPYSFPMLWWLSYLIRDELPDTTSPMAMELANWYKEDAELSLERQKKGSAIRARIPPTALPPP
jgi:hypothetical protein